MLNLTHSDDPQAQSLSHFRLQHCPCSIARESKQCFCSMLETVWYELSLQFGDFPNQLPDLHRYVHSDSSYVKQCKNSNLSKDFGIRQLSLDQPWSVNVVPLQITQCSLRFCVHLQELCEFKERCNNCVLVRHPGEFQPHESRNPKS